MQKQLTKLKRKEDNGKEYQRERKRADKAEENERKINMPKLRTGKIHT
jgi:hypothetical protein